MIQDQDIKSEHWWAGTDSHKQCGEDSKRVREIKVQQTERKVVKNWSMKKKREGERSMALQRGRGEKLFIPSFGCIPDCLFFFSSSSYLQTDWTHELPSPCLIQTFHTPVTMASTDVCRWLKKGNEERYACVISAFLIPLTGQTESKLVHRLEFGTAHNKSWPFPSHVTCMRANSEGFFLSTAPELLWKFNTFFFFFVPVEVGRDWKHSLWDNRLSKTPMTTPCSSQTWMSQQQVTQQLLQWFH